MEESTNQIDTSNIFIEVSPCSNPSCNHQIPELAVEGNGTKSFSYKLYCPICKASIMSNRIMDIEEEALLSKDVLREMFEEWNEINERMAESSYFCMEESKSSITSVPSITKNDNVPLDSTHPDYFLEKLSSFNRNEDSISLYMSIYQKLYMDCRSLASLAEDHRDVLKNLEESLQAIHHTTEKLISYLFQNTSRTASANRYVFYYQDRLLLFVREYIRFSSIQSTCWKEEIEQRKERIRKIVEKIKKAIRMEYQQITQHHLLAFESELEAMSNIIEDIFVKNNAS